MRITVLGKSPSWQDADGACAGHLVEHDGASLLLDCGNGVLGKLRRYRDYVALDAIVISHLHADHVLDLVPFACGLTYAPRQQPVPVDRWPGTDHPARPRLYAPGGATAAFGRLAEACGHRPQLIERAFELHEYGAGDELAVGGLAVAFREVPHFLPTYAVGVSAGDGRFTYGADCRPNDDVIDFARDSDLLMLEATLPRPERAGQRGHLTPAEAGEHARRAGARALVLTHISDELDYLWARREASRAFGGAVRVAAEGDVYRV